MKTIRRRGRTIHVELTQPLAASPSSAYAAPARRALNGLTAECVLCLEQFTEWAPLDPLEWFKLPVELRHRKVCTVCFRKQTHREARRSKTVKVPSLCEWCKEKPATRRFCSALCRGRFNRLRKAAAALNQPPHGRA